MSVCTQTQRYPVLYLSDPVTIVPGSDVFRLVKCIFQCIFQNVYVQGEEPKFQILFPVQTNTVTPNQIPRK